MSQPVTSEHKTSLIRWLLPIAILLIAIAVFYFLIKSKPSAPSRPVEEKVWSVQTINAELATHQPLLTLYGKVESPRMTRVTAAVTAFVAEVATDEGKTITPGEQLLRLDDRDTQLLLQQRQADVENILAQIEAEKVRFSTDKKALAIEQKLLQLNRNTVTRYENLSKRNVSSQEQLDNARKSYQQQSLSLTSRQQAITDHPNRLQQLQSQLLRAQSLLDAAKLDLSRTQITAPFNGRVAQLDVAPGDRVRAGDPLLSIYSVDRLEVRAQIPNKVLSNLRQHEANTEINARAMLDGKPLDLELDRLAAAVNGGRAGVDALFSLKSSDYTPEPGRSLAISVTLPAVDHLVALPPMALYGLNRIYRVQEQRLQALEVIRIGDSISANGAPKC